MEQQIIDKTITNLVKNNFKVKFFDKEVDAVNKIIADLKDAKSISRGGSLTIEEIGLIHAIKENNLPFRDYRTPEDRIASISAEYYITSTNAIISTGELLNIDGAGNRVAAMNFGPQHVLIVAGKNKIVETLAKGFERIKNIAAPLNAKRLNKNTPCAETNKCEDCSSDDRICRKISIINKPVKGRFTIYLINENLGY